jgi:hypothetical protein
MLRFMDDITITPDVVQEARAYIALHSQDASEELAVLDALNLLDPEKEHELYERV